MSILRDFQKAMKASGVRVTDPHHYEGGKRKRGKRGHPDYTRPVAEWTPEHWKQLNAIHRRDAKLSSASHARMAAEKDKALQNLEQALGSRKGAGGVREAESRYGDEWHAAEDRHDARRERDKQRYFRARDRLGMPKHGEAIYY